MGEADAATVERHEFGAEVGRLLDLVVHALYSEREIFLRELVANAADAIDRRRFEALTQPTLALPDGAKVLVVPDKAARTLTISDPGIGMSKADLVENLGTIARSGTLAFARSLSEAQATSEPADKPSLIGQFGVGFYSAFMVAERVDVTSRRAGSEEAWTWSSDGRGEYSLAPAERTEAGTGIVLHMKPDAEEFLEPLRLRTIIRKWADHIAVPIALVQDGKEEAANEGTALWRKPKSEVSKEAYAEFYRHLGHLFDEPWATLHWRAEGVLDFSALLFVPGMKPFVAVEEQRESRVRLHVRRMFITDQANLLPPWLRFVQGVVDTEDLPLNVSREMLQSTPVLARIRKAVTSRVLSELKSRAKETPKDAAPSEAETPSGDGDSQPSGYAKFWENFGPILKEGVYEDAEHRKDLAPLLRFRSSGVEGWTGLADYVARMKPGQDAIYVLVGDDAETLAKSSQLEGFRARGVEVLLLSDGIDAFWPERMGEFDGKPIRSITQGAVDLSKIEGTAASDDAPSADVSVLIPMLKEALKDDVSDVRTTDRLVSSAVALAAPEGGPDLQMQRLMRRAGRGFGASRAVLEVNPRHPLVRRIADDAAAGKQADVSEAAGMLLDLARVQDGDSPRDPVSFAQRVARAMAGAALALALALIPGLAGAAELPARIRAAGKLVIATFPNYPPLTFRDPATNQRMGFDVDLGDAIGREIGVPVEWTEMAFVQMIPGLQTGRADLAMDGIGDLPARRETVDMVDYLRTGARFMTSAANAATIRSPQDLCGKRVGASRSTSWPADIAAWSERECVAAGRPPIQVVGTEGSIDARTQLRSGRLDGSVQGEETITWFQKAEPAAYVPLGQPFTQVLVGIPVSKTEPALRDAVRAALERLHASGEYASLLRKWNLESSAIPAIMVNGAP